MEDQTFDFWSLLISFVKQNALILVLGVFGLVFIGVGIVQALHHDSKPDVQFKAADESVSPKAASISVDVSGAVVVPGVYSLSQGARIQDALARAGGLSAEADSAYVAKTINLAQKLQDGSKLYIPKQGEQAVASAQVSGSTLVNINSATASELDSLPGIGAVTEAKIIEARPYTAIDELVSKKAVSKSVFEKIKDKVLVY